MLNQQSVFADPREKADFVHEALHVGEDVDVA
jgi:hypothetical protein